MNSSRWQIWQNIRMKNFYLGHLFHIQVSPPFSAGSLYPSHEITGLESHAVQSHSHNLLSEATRPSCFCFLIKMPTGCLFFFIPFIHIHKLTKSVNNSCRWSGVLLDWRLYKTSLLMESEGLLSSTLTPFSPVRLKKKKKVIHSFIHSAPESFCYSVTASHWAPTSAHRHSFANIHHLKTVRLATLQHCCNERVTQNW